MKLEFSRQSFEKYSNIKFHENMTSGHIFMKFYMTSGADACEYGNELSGSIKCGEFLD